ncbi:MAG: hypothetical protein MHM6MM_006803 [Cercozoa sp. M6MM]
MQEFFVAMTCGGCSGAVTRILSRVEGVDEVQCDIEKKQVLVSGEFDVQVALAKLLKWAQASGKEVRYVGPVQA